MKTIENRKSKTGNASGFTLIELLVVIAIIGVLAAMTIPVLGVLKRQQDLRVARAEIEQISTALDDYKAKYGVYPPANANSALWPQLYYELSGTYLNGAGNFETLDGTSTLSPTDVKNAYGVDGFINCTHGSSEDGIQAKNFLPSLKPNRYALSLTNNTYGKNVPNTVLLITSVGGPDQNYQPLGVNTSGLNPFRYAYPGTNNPNSYDLWVQLVIKGKTNLICNWNKQVIINSSLP